MNSTVFIENIVEMRRQAGIDDPALEDAIRGLAVGDLVRVTLRAGQAPTGETVVVRITEIGAAGFRGTLAVRPTAKSFADLRAGQAVDFTADHIHSIPNARKADIR